MDNLHAHYSRRHELTTKSSRSTLQYLSSSWPGQAADQHSRRLLLQSCLQRLDHLDGLERRVHDEIQEIRSLVVDLLDNYQSDVTMENSSGCDNTVDSQARLDGLNVIPPFVSLHDSYFVSQPAPHGTLSESTRSPQGLLAHNARSSADYVTQVQRNMSSEAFSALCDPRVTDSSAAGVDTRFESSLRGTSNSVYAPAAQPFQGIHSEEHVPSSSSARPDAQLSIPVVQASQVKDKVKCTRSGCSALINKDNLSRHVKEVHEGKIKAVCAGCGKEFKRPYQMSEHILRTQCGRS